MPKPDHLNNPQRKKAAFYELEHHLKYIGISPRELNVTVSAMTGASIQEMAEHLQIEVKTVKFHLTNIFKKVNVARRAELLAWCYKFMIERM
jgi:DNA-binding CsgD family transcriptional regulator